MDMSANENLQDLRARLDRIDRGLISLLGRREQVIREVARHKQSVGMAVKQPSRIDAVFETRMQRAREAGLDPKLVERLWTTILSHAAQVQNEVRGIEEGDLNYQGVCLDHGELEVADFDGARKLLCARLSFEVSSQSASRRTGRRTAVLTGGDVVLVVRERLALAATDPRPTHMSIQVHALAPVIRALKTRGNSVAIQPETCCGIRMASVHVEAPANLSVCFVERPARARLDAPDLRALPTLGGF